jgi:transposase InsO family protein
MIIQCAKAFSATLECELIRRFKFKDRAQASLQIFDLTEGWTNKCRRHLAIDYISPAEFEWSYRILVA